MPRVLLCTNSFSASSSFLNVVMSERIFSNSNMRSFSVVLSNNWLPVILNILIFCSYLSSTSQNFELVSFSPYLDYCYCSLNLICPSSLSISPNEWFILTSSYCLSLFCFFYWRLIITSRILTANFIAVILCRSSFEVEHACKLQQNTILPLSWIKFVNRQDSS